MTTRLAVLATLFTMLIASRPARAGIDGELAAGGLVSVPASSPVGASNVESSPRFGLYETLRGGFRLGPGSAVGLGVTMLEVPTAVRDQNRLGGMAQLYYRDVLHAEGLDGATIELAIGGATAQACLGNTCELTLLPATTLAFGVPLATGFGDLLANFGLTFELGTGAVALGSTLTPMLGVAWIFPGE